MPVCVRRTESTGLNSTNGAVFWLQPDAGPTHDAPAGLSCYNKLECVEPLQTPGNIPVAQITIPTGTVARAIINAQGRITIPTDPADPHGPRQNWCARALPLPQPSPPNSAAELVCPSPAPAALPPPPTLLWLGPSPPAPCKPPASQCPD